MSYREIAAHYERCLEEHGDSHRGVDWPDPADAETRYRVMLDLLRTPRPGLVAGQEVSLLDFGCGASHLLDSLRASGLAGVRYTGLDISPKFVELSRRKHPEVEYLCLDVLAGDTPLPTFDYVVLNGVFTEKLALSHADMFAFMRALLTRVWKSTRRGIAFNVMSKHVDWERDDLFHVSFDEMAVFVKRDLTRHFSFRADYGLWEYTVYAFT